VQAEEQRKLSAEGADVEAVVTRRWQGSGESRPRWVAYTFSVGNVAYTGQARAERRDWENLETGSLLRVRYAVGQPELNAPYGWKRKPRTRCQFGSCVYWRITTVPYSRTTSIAVRWTCVSRHRNGIFEDRSRGDDD
jgi:hypothetical protein